VNERHADQFLGVEIGPASRDEVLTALHGHNLGRVVITLENTDGSPLLHASGILQQLPDHGPAVFAVQPETAVLSRQPERRPLMWFQVPKDGIVQYSEGGYRFMLAGGAALVVLLWHSVLHVTPSGDVAPGLGGFNVSVEERDDDG
jgi:hypothetical protein